MASADLRDELTCSVCLNIYTEPITLPCGHSFCRVCIAGVLDTQLSCPECRQSFRIRPKLKRNLRLSNISKHFLSTEPPNNQRKIEFPCTYCDYPEPAAKTCLLCEASLCDKHLKNHSQSAEHILTEPTSSLRNRKCSVHKKVLEYYCTEDAACICVSCCLVGVHKGHQVKSLNETFEEKKIQMRESLEKLTAERVETKTNFQILWKMKVEVQEKVTDVTGQVKALITDIRGRLDNLEHQVLSEISRQEDKVSHQISDLIRQLETKKDILSKEISEIEENLCNMTDPLTVLQQQVLGRCEVEDNINNMDREREDKKVHAMEDLDLGLSLATLHSGITDIATVLRGWNMSYSSSLLNVNMAPGTLLDINTACNKVAISGNMKMASTSGIPQGYWETPERFQVCLQVLSTFGVSCGRYYFEMETSNSGYWRLGLAYPSIERKGDQAVIGYNDKSWVLEYWNSQFSAVHNHNKSWLSRSSSVVRFGMYLDYKTGRLSFYELCNPVRELHTFTATFTEPLYVALSVYGSNNWIRIIN
ncbi:E3 ubiquitin ISG15 ligase TRIM25-like [Pelobates cultripes]|uniref:E3 ubiquitin ISG15 ligase TRIM25-like n=1 Tax=Pelobates cultripes TaxID=61616 RepID=A0AAD1QWH3_PELCU|nr:E3 ubiquitin ISG15 ligase TRIM25-like [Pelobates cultripes]